MPALVKGLIPCKILLTNTFSKEITTTSTLTNTILTVDIRAISIYSRGSDAYFVIGNLSQLSNNNRHFIASGERLDIDVSAFDNPYIATIFGPSGITTVLHISELQ